MDLLPTEIFIRILNELPLSEAGGHALARCGMTGHTTLRAASLEPVLWRSYYELRYTHSECAREIERRRRLHDNWTLMYRERRRLDSVALENVKALEACDRKARIEHARLVVHLGLDVWDALSEQVHCPPPTLFHKDEDIQKVKDGYPIRNLTRKYWASELLRVIARRNGIEAWIGLKHYISHEGTGGINPLSFEEAFANLSSFFGILPSELVERINFLTDKCRKYLEDNGIPYAPEAEGFNAKVLCNAVSRHLRVTHGFGRALQTAFYDFRNSLPHLFMNCYRHTLPLSLVFVYVGIMRRLGLESSPLNTPGNVMALIRDIVVDVSGIPMNSTVGVVEDYEEVKGIFTTGHQAVLTTQLLSRAARNIHIAGVFEFGNGLPEYLYEQHDVSMWFQAKFLVQCLLALFPSGPADNDELIVTDRSLFPFDMELVVDEKLLPNLPTTTNLHSTAADENKDEVQGVDASNVSFGIDLFVGQIVTAENSILRCVTGWKIKDGQMSCSTIAYCHHLVNDFPIPAVTPVMCSAEDLKSFLRNPIIGQYFEDAELHELGVGDGRGRGRFIMNERLRKMYPGEDARGARWVRGE